MSEILRDFFAKFLLFVLDLFDIKDSSACAIASNPDEDLILFGALITKLGIKKKKSGLIFSFSTEYFILFI